MRMQFRHYPRVRSLLTIEGLGLVVILGFVAVCSVLRNVNLLVVVTGMMLLPLILCWRLSRESIRSLIAQRIVSNRTHANAPANIQWKLTNASPIDIYKLRVIDSVRQVLSRNGEVQFHRHRSGVHERGTSTFDKLPASESQYASYQVHFAERGIYELGPATIESRYPLALIKSWFQLAQRQTVHVAPQLGELAANWSAQLIPIAVGRSLKNSQKSMMDEDFFAIREWRSGDNKRKIHWRSTAKLGEPMVKQFESTTEQNLAIVLDLFADPRSQATGTEFNKMAADCEVLLSFATTVLSGWADQPKGQLCIALSDQDPAVLNSNTESEFVSKTMRALAVAQHSHDNRLASTLSQVLDQISPNVPCIVVSTRSLEESKLQVDPELLTSVSWIQSNDPGFQQIFRTGESKLVLPTEYSPTNAV